MGLDLDRVRRRQAETKKGSSGDRFTPQEGINRIRVFKFSHKVTQADVDAGFYAANKLGKVVDEIDRPITMHFGVSADRRPVKSTPELIREYKRLAESSNEADRKQAEAIKPQTKYVLNIMDVNSTDGSSVMKYWLAPKSVYNEILGCILDPDYGEDILGSGGREFVLQYNKAAEGAAKYSIKVRDADKCKKLDAALDKAVCDFYSPAGEVKLGFASTDVVDGSAPEEEEEKPAAKPKSKAPPTQDDEEEARPKAAAKKATPASSDEEFSDE